MNSKSRVHYFLHFLIASIGLYGALVFYGSITIWEIILFYFLSLLPVLDEFTYALIHYVSNSACRDALNVFLVGEVLPLFEKLHEKRVEFTQLIIHNIPVFLSLWALWYASLLFESPLLFYGTGAVLIHLWLDVANDQLELRSIRRWFWPVIYLLPLNT